MSSSSSQENALLRWAYNNRVLLFVLLVVIGVCVLLFWEGVLRYRVQAEAQQTRLEVAADAAATEVELLIADRIRGVGIFATEQAAMIADVARYPENEELQMALEEKVLNHFPTAFAVTAADGKGMARFEDFDGRVGALCLQDIRSFATGDHPQKIMIHPNPVAYHFDVMVRSPSGVFFVSFRAAPVAALLSRRTFDGHRFLLIHRDQKGLIEIGKEGARDKMGTQIRLSDEQLAQVAVKRPVNGTAWLLVVIPNAQILENVRRYIWVQAAWIASVVAVLGLVMLLLVRREGRKRAAAVEADRRKTEFLSTMSHEIRNPMNSIIGLGQLLRDSRLNTEQRNQMEGLCYAADSLLELLNDVLDMSRIEAGRLSLESVEMDLRLVIDGAADIVSGQRQGKDVEFAVIVDPQMVLSRMGDPMRVRQVLVNLLGNAIKFTDQGHVRLDVDEREPGRVRFSVSDTGIGLSEEQSKKLFQPFVQAKNSTSRHYGGTGLGLSICKRIVHLMGGEMGVDSVEGEGSTFWFEVGLPPVDVQNNESDATPMGAILLVTPSVLTAEAFKAIAKRRGMSLEWVRDEAEAREMLQSGGEEDGKDVLIWDAALAFERSLIRHRAGRKRTQLILLQGHAGEGSRLVDSAPRLTCPVSEKRFLDALTKLKHTNPHPKPARTSREQGFQGKATILIVDDEPMNRSVASRMLMRMGMTPVAVESGESCVEYLSQNTVDLVLLDCQMPGMDGYETASRLRSEVLPARGQANLPIIAMTAGVLSQEQDRTHKAGMNDFLPKPVRLEGLRKMLQYWLEGEGRQANGHAVAKTLDTQTVQAGQAEWPVLDNEIFKEHAQNGEDFVAELIRRFLEEAPVRMGHMNEAADMGDLKRVHDEAHALKGIAAIVGGKALEHRCRALMVLIDEGDNLSLGPILKQAQSDHRALVSMLEARL